MTSPICFFLNFIIIGIVQCLKFMLLKDVPVFHDHVLNAEIHMCFVWYGVCRRDGVVKRTCHSLGSVRRLTRVLRQSD